MMSQYEGKWSIWQQFRIIQKFNNNISQNPSILKRSVLFSNKLRNSFPIPWKVHYQIRYHWCYSPCGCRSRRSTIGSHDSLSFLGWVYELKVTWVNSSKHEHLRKASKLRHTEKRKGVVASWNYFRAFET